MANKKRRCTHCKEYDIADNGIITPNGWFHDIDCVTAYAKKRVEKQRAAIKRKAAVTEKKKHSKRKRDFYDNDLSWQHEQTQKSFNKLRKLQEFKWFADRGLQPVCISCNKENMDWCNGHFKSVGSHSELRYDEMNTYLQCNKYCNCSLSANINGNKTSRGYLQGLSDRFGPERAREVTDYCAVRRVRIWTCSELADMRKQFNKEIRSLIN